MPGLLDVPTKQEETQSGLLGTSWDDPRTTAVFSAIQGLLAPGGSLRGIANGVSNYASSMIDSRRQKQIDELRDLQKRHSQLMLNQLSMQQAGTKRQQDFLSTLPLPGSPQAALLGGGGPTVANASGVSRPDAHQQQMLEAVRAGVIPYADYLSATRKDSSPVKLGPGDMLLAPQGDAYRLLASNPKEDRLDQLVINGPDGRPMINQLAVQAKQAIAHAGRPQVSVQTQYENEFAKSQGKDFSEMMSGINKAAFNAPTQIRKLERMSQLLDGVDGGKLSPMGLDVASAMNSVGLKVDPRLGNKEAAEALARELAGGLRQPGTGPMTDKDFDNFLTQVPSLSKTAQGRKQITATMTSALNRDMAVAKMARDYSKRNGRIDNNFLDELATYIAENPVIAAPSNWTVQR